MKAINVATEFIQLTIFDKVKRLSRLVQKKISEADPSVLKLVSIVIFIIISANCIGFIYNQKTNYKTEVPNVPMKSNKT